MAERNVAIDAFKGMAIIGVVVAHTLLSTKEPAMSDTATPASVLSNILFSGLMMFLVFSGFFFNSERKYFENVLKRAIQLGLVMIILLILLPLIVAAVGFLSGNPNINFDILGNCILGSILGEFFADYAGLFPADYLTELYYCTKSYYFIQMMLVGFLVFYAIANKCYEKPKYAVAAILVCVAAECGLNYLFREYGTRLPFFSEMAPMCVAFMLVGLLMKRYNFHEYLAKGYETAKYWAIAALLILCGAAVFCVFPLNMSLVSFSFGFKFGAFGFVFFFAGTTLAGIGLIMLSGVFRYLPPLKNAFSFVGKYTLWIFLTNIFFVRIILVTYGKPGWSIVNASPITTMPEAVFYFFFALACSLLFGVLVEKAKEKLKAKRETAVQ